METLDDWTTGLTHSVSAGNDRLLVFVVGAEHGTPPIGSITGVTWGGQALTPVGSAAVINVEENRLEVWYLDEAGITAVAGNSFVITGWTGTDPDDELYYAASFKNVDQGTPVGSPAPPS